MANVSSSSSSSSGVGFAGLLTVAFVVLKLVGKIQWPWIWVLSPLWIVFTLVLGLVAFLVCMAAYSGQSKR